MTKSANDLREDFLKFFESKKHQRIRSSGLIPMNDPTLLFTNAGMNQFKDYFTGKEKPTTHRATTCQKCVRAGGKHNDLESVGKTKRHHTFFEMLGNFSFGDYFKEEAISFAWEFITEIVKLPKDHLWVSVFKEDDEAFEIWEKKIGIPKNRIVRMDEKDNFWSMGDTGPCGPCSEIYIDRGESFGKSETIYDGGDRFLEIWNLVFMQFEKKEDGSMIPLPKPSVDTGMGLERLAAVVQNVDSNYDIDSMRNIIGGFEKLTAFEYGKSKEVDIALKVLTDHIRSCSFLISDGVQPSNEGRGYVLRRILRRAIRFGKNLNQNSPFFYKGVQFVVSEMGAAYPELVQNQSAVEEMIRFEEEKFYETLESGLKLLSDELENLKSGQALDGRVAFKLYDTFGFPLDLTEMILEERNLKLDHIGFNKALEEQRERSRKSWKGSGESSVTETYHQLSEVAKAFQFTGYQSLKESSQILGLIKDGQLVDKISQGEEAEVLISLCPFYAESGGQVGDQGRLESSGNIFEVLDTQKPLGSFHILHGKVSKGSFKKSDSITALVDSERRMQTRIHHTMTHVLHAALQEILGNHIKQAGSQVGPDHLRFDFTHMKALSSEEIERLEDYCNEKIRMNPNLKLSEESLDDAIRSGAKAFFEDKYGDQVRVLRIGAFSTELCGGTHAESLAEAGIFKIVSESSVASGVRRIVAVTAKAAERYIKDEEKILYEVASKLKTSPKEILNRIEKMMSERKELLAKLSQKSSSSSKTAKDLVQEIENILVVLDLVEVGNAKELRPLADDYQNQIKKGVVVLGARIEGKATVVVSVSKDIAKLFNTNELVKKLGESLGGKGGGRPDFAQVGGSNVEMLSKDLIQNLVTDHIKNLKISA